MRRLPVLAIALVCVALLWRMTAGASDSYRATITTTDGGSMMSDAGAGGWDMALQCNWDARYRTCSTGACYATANDALIAGPGGSQVLVGPISDFKMPKRHTYVAVTPTDGGAVTCRLYKVEGYND